MLLALSVAAGILLPQAPSSLTSSDNTARWLAETSSRYGSLGGVLQSAGLFDVWQSDWFRGSSPSWPLCSFCGSVWQSATPPNGCQSGIPPPPFREARRWPVHATIELDGDSVSVVAELTEVLFSEGWRIAHVQVLTRGR